MTDGWATQILFVGVASARVAAAFALMPLFNPETIPPLVRNSIFLSLGLVSLALQPALPGALAPAAWAAVLIKEAFVGIIIGFFFGSVLWALEAAGEIIDTKIGATMAQIIDPLSGHQTQLNAAFLGRLANLVFIFSGGLMLLMGVVIESYALWPITSPLPRFDSQGLALFEQEFGRLMVLATLFAAPVLIILFIIDAGLGLINRFTQELNVFAMSISIKAVAGTALIMLLVGSFVEAIMRDMASRPPVVTAIIEALANANR
jgi:type III secretion protein T